MLTVSDIMTKPVVVIRTSATIANAMWVMRSQRVRSLVVEKIKPEVSYGMLTEKDIVYSVIAAFVSLLRRLFERPLSSSLRQT